jgi:glyoxylase-like metal-dependent hydrolase (beta-lactamase superfamily II)
MKYCLTLTLILLTQLAFTQNRAITKIHGDLYRFQNNNHFSVFLVTSEGIVVTDPINKEAASWLNRELADRFDVPVTHLIYSHDHADHISGGEAFGDDVVVIGHELTKEAILREKRNVPVPEVTFDNKYTLKLGGQRVELYYPGKSHGDNCIAMLFPGQSTVFVVDFITVDRLPYRNLGGGHMPDWISAIKFVEGLDFNILAPGHGAIGTKADATNHRKYFEALRDAVSKAMKEGQSLAEMEKTIQLGEFNHFGNYEQWLPLNIEGMYNMLSKN